jgi:hypothetical protein
MRVSREGKRGVSITVNTVGALVAFAMSYSLNSSLLWGIFHFFMSWIYVMYWLFSYTHFKEWMLQWVV